MILINFRKSSKVIKKIFEYFYSCLKALISVIRAEIRYFNYLKLFDKIRLEQLCPKTEQIFNYSESILSYFCIYIYV